jgi:hypothetical protein
VLTAIEPALAQGGDPPGWVYGWNQEPPWWRPITSTDDLTGAFVACLSPRIARYNPNTGLHLGEQGDRLSPTQEPRKRPGHGSLKREPWTLHATLVAKQAEHRLRDLDGIDSGVLGRGFIQRYGLSPQAVLEAARATALLHDLGKLRTDWQRWAERVQQDRDASYQHTEPLAHTDYDPDLWVDRDRERRFRKDRPPHAAPSAFYATAVLADLLPSVPEDRLPEVAAACIAAILGHHGSWLPSQAKGPHLEIKDGLAPGWQRAVQDGTSATPDTEMMSVLIAEPNKRGPLEEMIAAVASDGTMREWWPLVAYLTRTLRLSDQKATAEGAGHGD